MNTGVQAGWWRPDAAPTVIDETPDGTSETTTGSSAPFWALMAFTFILLISPQDFLPIGAIRPALLAAAVAAGAYLLDRVRRGQPIADFTSEMVLAGLLAGWALLTLPFSLWPGGSLSFFIGLYAKALIIFWLIAHVVATTSRLRITAWGLTLMSIPLAAVAGAHFLGGKFLEGTPRIAGYEAPLTGNPNDLALMLNLILPLAVALFRSASSFRLRLLLATVIFLDATAVILTFSRAGFLTLTVVFSLFLWKFGRRRELGIVLCGLFIAGLSVFFFPSGYSERLSTISNFEADPTGSAQVRWNDTKAAVRFVAKNPMLGAGLGMDELAMNRERGPEWTAVHNSYLQYAVELGLPGVLLFCLLFRSVYRSVRRAQARCRGAARGDLFHLSEGIQISLLAFAVSALFYPVAYHFYFYYFAGLAVAAKKICQPGLRR